MLTLASRQLTPEQLLLPHAPGQGCAAARGAPAAGHPRPAAAPRSHRSCPAARRPRTAGQSWKWSAKTSRSCDCSQAPPRGRPARVCAALLTACARSCLPGSSAPLLPRLAAYCLTALHALTRSTPRCSPYIRSPAPAGLCFHMRLSFADTAIRASASADLEVVVPGYVYCIVQTQPSLQQEIRAHTDFNW